MDYAYIDSNPTKANGELTVQEKIQYSLLGIVLLGGVVMAGRSIVKRAVAKNEQKKTLSDGSPATYAKQIKMAFDNDGWLGTDKESLREVFRNIPTVSDFKKTVASYQKLYNRNLLADMQSELKTTEYNEMLAIVSVKPKTGTTDTNVVNKEQLQAWAKRLKAAFEISYGPFPGTDEDAIKAVFIELPTQTAFAQVAAMYKSLFGDELIDDLKSELEFWEYQPMLQIINSKPKN